MPTNARAARAARATGVVAGPGGSRRAFARAMRDLEQAMEWHRRVVMGVRNFDAQTPEEAILVGSSRGAVLRRREEYERYERAWAAISRREWPTASEAAYDDLQIGEAEVPFMPEPARVPARPLEQIVRVVRDEEAAIPLSFMTCAECKFSFEKVHGDECPVCRLAEYELNGRGRGPAIAVELEAVKVKLAAREAEIVQLSAEARDCMDVSTDRLDELRVQRDEIFGLKEEVRQMRRQVTDIELRKEVAALKAALKKMEEAANPFRANPVLLDLPREMDAADVRWQVTSGTSAVRFSAPADADYVIMPTSTGTIHRSGPINGPG